MEGLNEKEAVEGEGPIIVGGDMNARIAEERGTGGRYNEYKKKECER